MDLKEFEVAVDRCWDVPNDWKSLFVMSTGVAEEGGEVAGVLKKWVNAGMGEPPIEKLTEEMGDNLYYLVKIASYFGISMEDVMDYQIAKCEGRGYGSVQASSEEPAVRGWEG